MNNQELITALAKRIDLTQKDTSDILEGLVAVLRTNLEKGNSINIQGFGAFEARKKKERISVNPVSKQRFLIPPKITVAYKPGQTIKDNLKKMDADE